MTNRSSLIADRKFTTRPLDIKLGGTNIVAFENYKKRPLNQISLSFADDVAATNEVVYFPFTVDSDFADEAQNILRRTCGESISEMKIELLVSKHQTKIWISLRATAYSLALHALIIGLPAAELGSVTHIFK